jgi:hypothetical protein
VVISQQITLQKISVDEWCCAKLPTRKTQNAKDTDIFSIVTKVTNTTIFS